MEMDKRGLSELVVIVLIVLVSVAGVLLLYNPVKNIIIDSGGDNSINTLNPEFSIISVNFTNDCANIKIIRNFLNENTIGMRFIFKNSTSSYFRDITLELPGELEEKSYGVCLGKNITNVLEVDVGAIAIDKDGKEVVGAIDSRKNPSGWNLEGVANLDLEAGFIFTFFRYYLDSEYNSNLVDEIMASGYTHVGITKYSRGSDVSQELIHIRQKGYKIALHMSSGHKSDGPYPELANALADNGNQFFKTSCINKILCEHWNNSNHGVDPSYTGILWQNALDNIRNDTYLIKPDIEMIDTEIWSNPRDAEYYFLSGDPNRDCNCYAIRDGIGYDSYYKNWSARGKEMYDAVKQINNSIQVLFYDELKQGINKTLSYYDFRDIVYNYGYMPSGTGDIPNPSIYIGANLDSYEKNANLGVFNGTLPYISFSYMNGFSNFGGGDIFYDSSVSKEAGRIMARSGARGFVLYPIQGPTNYIVEHSRAMIAGFYEAKTYVEKNKIKNSGFESFKTKSDSYDYGGSGGSIRLVGDTRFIPVFWNWSDTNPLYDDHSLYANLTADKQSGYYAWRHSRLGEIGNRTVWSKNFTISAGDEGSYGFSIWTKASLTSNLGKIKYFIQEANGNNLSMGENYFASDWNKFNGNLMLNPGNYKLWFIIEDKTGQNVDVFIDNASLMKTVCGNGNCEGGENNQNCAADCSRELISISNTIMLESNHIYDLSEVIYQQTQDRTVTLKCKNSHNITITGAHLIGKGSYLQRVFGSEEVDDNWDIGIALVDCENITIQDFKIENFQISGIAMLRSKSITIKDGSILGTDDVSAGDNTQFNIWISEGSENITIDNLDISQTAQGIYSSNNCRNITIVNNVLHDIPGQHGLYLGQTDNLVVQNNIFNKINYLGMKVQMDTHAKADAKNILITNNSFYDVGGHAILLTKLAGSGYTVVNAIISNNSAILTKRLNSSGDLVPAADGISIIYSLNTKVFGNNLIGARWGIRVDCLDSNHGIEIYDNSLSESISGDYLIQPICGIVPS